MAKYTVTLINASQHIVTASDVQINEGGVKFLNGKGKEATVVAYFSGRVVESVVEVTE